LNLTMFRKLAVISILSSLCTTACSPAAPSDGTESSGAGNASTQAEASGGTAIAGATPSESATTGQEGSAIAAAAADGSAAAAALTATSTLPALPPEWVAPADAPMIPGVSFPSFGAIVAGPAYFPVQDTASRLMEGNIADAGMTWYRGEVLTVDAATGTATVRDLMDNEYSVPLSYILQGPAVTAPQAGEIYLGERFNRAELVMITAAAPDESGEYPSIALASMMSDTVRIGSDALTALVPVAECAPGTNVLCEGPDGRRRYMILRRAAGRVLAYDEVYVRLLQESDCQCLPLRPELQAGQAVTWARALQLRTGTVSSVDPTTGAVEVSYPWGDDTRTETTRFSVILPDAP
jgi:hypothetical protein